jgi:hypothetical protein
MHPGFPQSGNIPTPEERERHLQQMTDRARGEQDQAALNARDNILMLETRARTLGQGSKDRIPPMAVCYYLEALQRSGCFIDGLSLDISGPTANMANQLAHNANKRALPAFLVVAAVPAFCRLAI